MHSDHKVIFEGEECKANRIPSLFTTVIPAKWPAMLVFHIESKTRPPEYYHYEDTDDDESSSKEDDMGEPTRCPTMTTTWNTAMMTTWNTAKMMLHAPHRPRHAAHPRYAACPSLLGMWYLALRRDLQPRLRPLRRRPTS